MTVQQGLNSDLYLYHRNDDLEDPALNVLNDDDDGGKISDGFYGTDNEYDTDEKIDTETESESESSSDEEEFDTEQIEYIAYVCFSLDPFISTSD